MDVVSVALPVLNGAETLGRAAGCILAQTYRELDLQIILNGSDEATVAVAQELGQADGRIRVLRLKEANLAAALNEGLRQAKGPFVARMDADDSCPPDRIARQLAFLKENKDIGAVGCAYDVVGDRGRLFTVRPPTEAAETRWRLLLGNCFAHGSMMLRKAAVLELGGYDEACRRAQDYELWLRLSRRWGIVALPQVLYEHKVRDEADASRSTAEQADFAAAAMLAAWEQLGATKDLQALARAMCKPMTQGQSPATAALGIEEILNREGPSRETLLAWLWARHISPPMPRRAADVARRALIRELGANLRADGVRRIWLWGAGDHTRQVLEHVEDLGLEVAGIVDDTLAGERFGFAIVKPAALRAGDLVVLSSDWHEEAMWESSRACRERGVRVVQMYGSSN
jgi:hypothetical protein